MYSFCLSAAGELLGQYAFHIQAVAVALAHAYVTGFGLRPPNTVC
jgi:hypothetical protein